MPAARSVDSVARFFGVMQAGGCPCFVEAGLTAAALLSRAHAVGLRRIVLDDGSEAIAPDLEHGGVQVNFAADLLRESRKSASTTVIRESVGPADLAMMQLTSGSTGLPKGALLTHGNLLRHEEVEAAFGVPLVVSYGLSEATCSSTMNPVGARRIGTVGTALRGQQVGIVSSGTGAEAPAGAQGEIRIAGPCLMRGYAGPESESPIRDGWLRTGDLGCFDGDGYLTVTGRLKEVIARGGENLSPRAIEDVLER